MSSVDTSGGQESIPNKAEGDKISLVGFFRNSRLSTLFSGKQKESGEERMTFENGDTLVGDLIYNFPNDFLRNDEISFDGVIESPDGTREYKRLVAVFTKSKGDNRKDPVIWSGAKEIWGGDLKARVIQSLKGIAFRYSSKTDIDNLIAELEEGSM